MEGLGGIISEIGGGLEGVVIAVMGYVIWTLFRDLQRYWGKRESDVEKLTTALLQAANAAEHNAQAQEQLVKAVTSMTAGSRSNGGT